MEPHNPAKVRLNGFHDGALQAAHGESYVHLSFRLKKSTNWAKAGHQVAFGEIQLSKPRAIRTSLPVELVSAMPKIQQKSSTQVTITSATGASTWGFDTLRGKLISWTRSINPGLELITEGFDMDFYRALTDNDSHGHGRQWRERFVHQTSSNVRQVRLRNVSGGVQIEVTTRIAPVVLAWAVDTVFTYTFRGDTLHLHVHGKPNGLRLPDTLARFGITGGVAGVDKVHWWGRGPGESYRDKKLSQSVGNWESTVDDLWMDYEFPQDGGNRTDVRRVEFRDASGNRILRARFGDFDGASFTAMHYNTSDIDECTHPYQLHKRKRSDTVVRLDWMHHGQGGASCGPWTLDQYQLKTNREFDVEILLD